ncbi:LysR family transcriptional regulator [Niallia sp. 03133]|uniref:LysR family transcriptional regulator n=1 Tax=Niallia sp. 03133 TaxID=3458060 RepID=UPI004044DBB7
MEIKHLLYFIEVTRTGSFTQAANQLYITQPAISRIIKSLETEMGVSLFIRSRKKLALTEAGRVLYKHAQVFDKQFQLLKAEMDNVKSLKKGHIRIGLPSIVNSFFFSQLIASFHKEYPEITFQLVEDGSKRIEEKVLDDKLDLGVVVVSGHHDLLDYYSFVKEELKLIVPPSHRFANKQMVSLAELKNEFFIMFNQDFSLRDRIIAACNNEGFEPSIISETSQLDFIQEMVASNLGITLLPESTSADLTADVRAINLSNPKIDWNLSVIWKNSERLSKVSKEFIRFAKEKLLKNDK